MSFSSLIFTPALHKHLLRASAIKSNIIFTMLKPIICRYTAWRYSTSFFFTTSISCFLFLFKRFVVPKSL